MGILEQRLTLTEDRVSAVIANTRGLVIANPDVHTSWLPKSDPPSAKDSEWQQGAVGGEDDEAFVNRISQTMRSSSLQTSDDEEEE